MLKHADVDRFQRIRPRTVEAVLGTDIGMVAVMVMIVPVVPVMGMTVVVTVILPEPVPVRVPVALFMPVLGAMFMVVLVPISVSVAMTMVVSVIVTRGVLVGVCSEACKQRTFHVDRTRHAPCARREWEETPGILEHRARFLQCSAVRIGPGHVFEAHEVVCGRMQLDCEQRAVQYDVELGNSMHMGPMVPVFHGTGMGTETGKAQRGDGPCADDRLFHGKGRSSTWIHELLADHSFRPRGAHLPVPPHMAARLVGERWSRTPRSICRPRRFEDA